MKRLRETKRFRGCIGELDNLTSKGGPDWLMGELRRAAETLIRRMQTIKDDPPLHFEFVKIPKRKRRVKIVEPYHLKIEPVRIERTAY